MFFVFKDFCFLGNRQNVNFKACINLQAFLDHLLKLNGLKEEAEITLLSSVPQRKLQSQLANIY